MPYIKVNTDKIKTYTTELESIRTQINCIKQRFINTSNAIDPLVKDASINCNISLAELSAKVDALLQGGTVVAREEYRGEVTIVDIVEEG